MNESVIISFNRTISQRGTGLQDLDYPRGIDSVGFSLKLLDAKNDRMRILNSSDVLSDSASVLGLSLPHSIYAKDGSLYVSDAGNDRIVVTDDNGLLVTTYGSSGSGNGQFDYPNGVAVDDTHIYVCDRNNNRVQKLIRGTGAFVLEITGFSLPEGIEVIGGFIYVLDAGNKTVKKYTTGGVFIAENQNILVGYGTSISNISGVLAVVDNTDDTIHFINTDLDIIISYGQFSFPFDVAIVSDEFLYITQPHEVLVYDIKVVSGAEYVDEFEKMNKQLYPTGRAWWMINGSVFQKFLRGLALSESRLYASIINVQNDIVADSSLMSDAGVLRWEEVFGLSSAGTKDDRIAAILQRQGYPNNTLARQSKVFIESQLQLAGFDVYLHDNVINPVSSIYGSSVYGAQVYGNTAPAITILANEVVESKDAGFSLGAGDALNAVFYVGGSVFQTSANVPLARRDEFRNLLLILKPAHSAIGLYINYTV